MLRVDPLEEFPIVVCLIDETTGMPGTGQVVNYDIRGVNDSFLSPPVNGVLPESAVEGGIYRTTASIQTAGEYVIYATCSGFVSSAESLIINEESVYDLAKQNRHYNISVEDVPRVNSTATASQIVRNVPMNKTDYIVTKIKGDDDVDWSTTTASGVVYAWYENLASELPYKMGGPY